MLKGYESAPLLIYKVACLFAGSVSTFLGYRLFQQGIVQPNSTLEASRDAYKFALTAGPGIFFALFGAAVIAVTIHKGLKIQASSNTQQARPAPIGHEYDVVKHWYNLACSCIRDAHLRGHLTNDDFANFNMYTAELASAVEDLMRVSAVNQVREEKIGLAAAP
jgi:hypothetical protein